MDKTHSSQTIRLPAYTELLIDSTDRYKNGFPDNYQQITSSSNWRTNVQNYALNGYFTRVAVTQIQFQWNLPTIIAGYNDSFYVDISGGVDAGVHEIILVPGYYNPQDLAAEIEDQLQAECPGSGFTCVWSVLNGAFVIQATESFIIVSLSTIASTLAPGDANRFRRTYTTLGFQYSGASNGASTEYYASPPTMLYTRYIDILSSYLAKFQDVKDSSTSQNLNFNCKIARVYPISASLPTYLTETAGPSYAPFIITIDYATPKQIMWNPDEAVNNFDIQLRDEFGDIIPYSVDSPDAHAACEYAMTLLVSET
jgi:hypothetical protein